MVNRKEFLWNTIASISASALSAVLLLLTTRINGVDAAGLFSIAFASATVLNAIADYGMRVYQVTDTNRRYAFDVYLSARIVVSFLMILVGIAFVIISGYTMEKALICLVLVGFRFVDAISETFQGEFQLNGRLDIAGKSVFIRMMISMSIFFVLNLVTHNITISCIAMMITNLILLVLYDFRKIGDFTKLVISTDVKDIKVVLRECFPLFFSNFLNIYIINAPKYAIDNILTYKMLTYFNILYLPTFTINLMSIFVLKPMLLTLGMMWNGNKYKKFIAVIGKMMLAIGVLTTLVEMVCITIGIPILEMIFGVKLVQFKNELLILVLSGGFSAFAVVLFYALTTMRCQKKVIIAYIMAAIGGVVLPNFMVELWGIMGAALASLLITFILFVSVLFIFIFEWKNKDQVNGR